MRAETFLKLKAYRVALGLFLVLGCAASSASAKESATFSRGSSERLRVQENLSRFWIQDSHFRKNPNGLSFRVAQRKWGIDSHGKPIATVWVNEAPLSLKEQLKFHSSKSSEQWLRRFHKALGVQKSRGGWFGDTYLLVGVSPRYSRFVAHSLKVEKGMIRVGTSFSALAPQFVDLLDESIFLQMSWMDSKSRFTETKGTVRNAWNFLIQAFASKDAWAEPLIPSSARRRANAAVSSATRKASDAVATGASSVVDAPVKSPGLSLGFGLEFSEKYLKSVDRILLESADRKASARIRQAGEEARASISQAGEEVRETSRIVGAQAQDLLASAEASATQLQDQVFANGEKLVSHSGKVIEESVDRSLRGALDLVGDEAGWIAAQVAVSSTLGAGLADGLLIAGSSAISYFVEWLSGIQDEKAFRQASEFLDAHGGLIQAQRARIRGILEQMDQVGSLTPDRLDQISQKFASQSHFLSARVSAWDDAMARAALNGDEDLHRLLYSCSQDEARKGKALEGASQALSRTAEVLSLKLGNSANSPILPFLCDQVEREIHQLMELELKTYEALHAYLKTQGRVADRSVEKAAAFARECQEAGIEKLKDGIQVTLSAFDRAMENEFSDCMEPVDEALSDSEGASLHEARAQGLACVARRDRIRAEFHEETRLERAQLVEIFARLDRDPKAFVQGCEDYSKLKAAALLGPLTQVTQKFLCYSGSSHQGSEKGASTCLFDEGGIQGQGGFRYLKELKALKHQKCTAPLRGEAPEVRLGESLRGTEECRSVFSRNLPQSSDSPSPSSVKVPKRVKARAAR